MKGKDQEPSTTVLFKDSLSFLGGSLANVTELAQKSGKSFDIVKQSLLCKTNDAFDNNKFELLLRKGNIDTNFVNSLKSNMQGCTLMRLSELQLI